MATPADCVSFFFFFWCSLNCRVAECIVMLLGQIAITIRDQHRVMETVVRAFQQRLFHPPSNLDGYIVIELGKIAAETGVSGGRCVCVGVSWGGVNDEEECEVCVCVSVG